MTTRRARFRFYAELNDLLPERLRFREFEHAYALRASVKDAIESIGVPHTEVDLILVNGQPVGFDHRLADGDMISVFPVFESLDIAALGGVRAEPLRETRFVVDANLGKLARLLRLLGFDSLYDRTLDDPELAEISLAERRVLVTRDRGLLKRSAVSHGFLVRSADPEEQAAQVLRRFDLLRKVSPLTRCLACNGILEQVDRSEVAARLPEGTRRSQEEFRRCADCARVYWPGSHHPGLLAAVDRISRAARPRSG